MQIMDRITQYKLTQKENKTTLKHVDIKFNNYSDKVDILSRK